jgi:hypothetical protein
MSNRMKRIVSVVALSALAAASVSMLRAEDKAKAAPEAPPAGAPDAAAMEKAWMEFATPGDPHKKLAALVGEWDVDSTDFTSGAPKVSKATAKFTMILGGRYLQQEYVGTYMGQPFEGVGITAYDNIKKQYVETWIDNMGTGLYVASGEEKDGKIHTAGKMSMPLVGQCDVRSVATQISPDEHVWEMFMNIPGQGEVPAVKMVYKRKK